MYQNYTKCTKSKSPPALSFSDPFGDRSNKPTQKPSTSDKSKEQPRRQNYQILSPSPYLYQHIEFSSKPLRTPSNKNIKTRPTSKPQTPTPTSQTYNNSSKTQALSRTPSSRNNSLNQAVYSSLRNSCKHFPFSHKNSGINTSSLATNTGNTSVICAPKDISREAFRFIQKIGSGGFGQVWKVEFKKNSRSYAMKEISKVKVILKKSVQSIMNEKQILTSLYNPFIVNMKSAFQDRENLYLVLDYLTGGDLRYHLCSKQNFSEEESKFIIANIVLGLQYIHENKIIHRDIKPENLVFQNAGYLRITDFGIARKFKEKNSHQTSGTPGYMSPQVICRLNHSFESDYFAVGVIAYEFMLRRRPYVGNSRKQIREHILSKQVTISKQEIPRGWSLEAADFVNRLLQRKKDVRLGYGGIRQIKKHPWLASINWEKLKNKQIVPPFIPKNVCETSEYLREIQFSEGTRETNYEEQMVLLRNQQIQDLFESYNEIGAFKMYFGKESTKSTFYTYMQHD